MRVSWIRKRWRHCSKMRILLIKELKNRGMPEENMLELTVERWRETHGVDDELHNGRHAMLMFWLNNPIRLGFGDEHKWETNLDKDVYVR